MAGRPLRSIIDVRLFSRDQHTQTNIQVARRIRKTHTLQCKPRATALLIVVPPYQLFGTINGSASLTHVDSQLQLGSQWIRPRRV
jgi:hypothetical protein